MRDLNDFYVMSLGLVTELSRRSNVTLGQHAEADVRQVAEADSGLKCERGYARCERSAGPFALFARHPAKPASAVAKRSRRLNT